MTLPEHPGKGLPAGTPGRPAARRAGGDIRMTLVESPPEPEAPTGLDVQPAARQLEPLAAKERMAPGAADTVPFRPVQRPPMALLQILDDNRTTAEFVRLRADRTVIGRSQGEIQIAHDPQVSSRHAEIARTPEGGGHAWYLGDLQSTNGTLIRVNRAALKHGDEFQVGRRRFRFESAPAGSAPEPAMAPAGIRETWEWRAGPPAVMASTAPRLVELTPAGEGRRFVLDKQQHWIGRDPSVCSPALADDATVSPRHARLLQDGEGWRIEDTGSLNGVWLRIQQFRLDSGASFLLGEQVFIVAFP